jgi:hypothetical protein
LNFSLYAMMGRQTIYSIRMITPIIALNPQTMDRTAPGIGCSLQVGVETRQPQIAISQNQYF